MKIVKLDQRYAGFPKWKYALQFPLRNHNYNKEYFKYKKVFQATYGPDAEINPEYHTAQWGSTPKWFYNENWHTSFEKRRIYYNDQRVMTMIQLKITD
jgi:hypothetical protein